MRKGFKVSTALSVTLLVFVVCFALAAAAAILILRNDRQTIELLGKSNIERASDLSDLNSRLFQARADLAEAKTYMESGLQEPRDAALKHADTLLAAARDSGKRLMANPENDPVGRPLFERVMNTGQALNEQILTPLHKAIGGWNGIEANRLAGQLLPDAGQRYVEAVDAFQAYARAQGRDAVADASSAQSRAMLGALAALALIALLALAIRLVFHRAILKPLNAAGQHFDRIADGDLTGRVAERSKNEIGVLYAAMARMQAGLGQAVASVRQGVEKIHAGTAGIAEAGNDMSARSIRQAGALQEASASLAQLADTVTHNADEAGQASRQVQEVASLARQGGQAVEAAVASMRGIATASKRIAEIVGVVDSIAFQTNLLALNAAVEAARAGTQGKGFAVVAGEVRTLAQRSAQAAREIKGLIGDASQRVDMGVREVGQAGATIGRVVQSVDSITAIMSHISQASLRQAEDLATVNRTVETLERHTQEDSAMVERTASQADELAGQAQSLRQAVAAFKLEKHAQADPDGLPAPAGMAYLGLPAAT
ncbi:MAG TPA: methyl-accepting chemotaxis protein [Bordetella sp.]